MKTPETKKLNKSEIWKEIFLKKWLWGKPSPPFLKRSCSTKDFSINKAVLTPVLEVMMNIKCMINLCLLIEQLPIFIQMSEKLPKIQRMSKDLKVCSTTNKEAKGLRDLKNRENKVLEINQLNSKSILILLFKLKILLIIIHNNMKILTKK